MPVSVVLVGRREGDGRVWSSLAAPCAALRLGIRDCTIHVHTPKFTILHSRKFHCSVLADIPPTSKYGANGPQNSSRSLWQAPCAIL